MDHGVWVIECFETPDRENTWGGKVQGGSLEWKAATTRSQPACWLRSNASQECQPGYVIAHWRCQHPPWLSEGTGIAGPDFYGQPPVGDLPDRTVQSQHVMAVPSTAMTMGAENRHKGSLRAASVAALSAYGSGCVKTPQSV